MLGVVGIILSLGLLMWLAWRDVSVILLAPLCALVAVLFEPGRPLLATYTQVFMPALGTFIAKYFPLFLLGAVYGKLMEDSGCAASISSAMGRWLGRGHEILIVVLSCAVLTYGGVSLFVVVFAVYPITFRLFRQGGLPRRLIPAAIALGSFTFTMTAMPGSVQIQNLIPMQTFDTDAFAAPVLGLIGSGIILGLGMKWLLRQAAIAHRSNEGFGPLPTTFANEAATVEKCPSAITAFLPVVVVIGMNYLLSQHVIPGWDTSYLATETYGKVKPSSVQGTWATMLAMVFAIGVVVVIHYRSVSALLSSLRDGATSALMPVFNTASEVGYGNTIASLAGFAVVRDGVTSVAPGAPLVSEAIAVNSLAGITGSASGGLSIAMETLGAEYLRRGTEAGIDPELMHRVASMSCGGLDSLPHNGAVITLLLICGVTHRQAYRDIGVVSVVCPILATAAVVILGSLFGTF